MKIERSITSLSWIPSDLMAGVGALGMRMHMAHPDDPPPEELGADIPDVVDSLEERTGIERSSDPGISAIETHRHIEIVRLGILNLFTAHSPRHVCSKFAIHAGE